jgi:apolipoprotein N-acyltransferase
LRIILTSERLRDAGIAALAGVLLALAFPKANAAWLAPLGAAALFWLWRTASWKRAFAWGWFAGTIFFTFTFSWFGHTVGSQVGLLAPLVALAPAAIEGLYVGAAGAASALAFTRAPASAAPLASAAAFTVFEWLRSIGTLGLPFGQLGYSQAGTPLALFAAYIGTYGVTFVLCLLGAYLADALANRNPRRLIAVLAIVAAAWLGCWAAWPARHVAQPTMRIAAVQGNVAQSLKWTASSVVKSIDLYTRQTQALAPLHPQLVVWPETAIAEQLNNDPQREVRFARLAHDLDTTLVVGAQGLRDGNIYNSLYIFGPQGALVGVYDKRQMVPVVESLPFGQAFAWVPFVKELGGGAMTAGNVDAVYGTQGLRFAPLICWESAFADVAHRQVQDGAQLLVVSTDDAWFGESAGPYMHAQIAQLRAIENGMWLVRAAATGVSGIIAPDGRYVAQSALDERTTISGMVGEPPGSPFARTGPLPVMLALILAYAALVLKARREPT